jgi:hypothetical protein
VRQHARLKSAAWNCQKLIIKARADILKDAGYDPDMTDSNS